MELPIVPHEHLYSSSPILKSVHKLTHVRRQFNWAPPDSECALNNAALKVVSANRKEFYAEFSFPQAEGICNQFASAGRQHVI